MENNTHVTNCYLFKELSNVIQRYFLAFFSIAVEYFVGFYFKKTKYIHKIQFVLGIKFTYELEYRLFWKLKSVAPMNNASTMVQLLFLKLINVYFISICSQSKCFQNVDDFSMEKTLQGVADLDRRIGKNRYREKVASSISVRLLYRCSLCFT